MKQGFPPECLKPSSSRWARLANKYLARRLLTLVPVWIGISVLAFVIGHLASGDPGEAILTGELGRPPSHAELAGFDRTLGLDRPLVVQYWHWVVGALHGNLGQSYRTGETVVGVLTSRLPATLVLASAAFALTVLIAVPLGTWAAFRASAWPDGITRVVSVGSAALPSFWVGYLLIIVFAVHWHLVPAQGNRGSHAVILPAVTLAVALVGVPLRLVRTSVLEVLNQDYVRTAKALGTPPLRVVGRHVLRNAVGPVVTYLGLVFAMELSTSVVVETVFAWPGVGLAVTDAIHGRDYPVVQGFVLLMGTVFVVVNLGVDLLYRMLDPRIRLGARAGAKHGG
ncbi:MAG: peptide/nickel transport system permease protein [Acidimicrobiaceae bacterium]|nr:peptide/nickel transport system permease protein [Acidimicrobiaceae bacterium]